MFLKVLNLTLIITSLIVYLEWGGNNRMFLFQGELEVLGRLIVSPKSVMHPFTLLPLIGQLCLLIAILQKKPSKILTWTGLLCIALLVVFICFIGIISFNYKVFSSTLPFLVTGFLTVYFLRKKK